MPLHHCNNDHFDRYALTLLMKEVENSLSISFLMTIQKTVALEPLTEEQILLQEKIK
jgi:hypothetical protein